MREYGKPETWPECRIPEGECRCSDEPCPHWPTFEIVRDAPNLGWFVLIFGLGLIAILFLAMFGASHG